MRSMRARRSSSYSDKGASGMSARLRDAGFLAAGFLEAGLEPLALGGSPPTHCEFGARLDSTASERWEAGALVARP